MKGRSRQQAPEPLWVSGINPVKEALRGGDLVIHEMVVARGDQRARELQELAKQRRVAFRFETRDYLSELLGHTHHQGVALRAEEYPYTDFESLLTRPMPDRDPLVILDCVQDPQNLGALIRSACFLGGRAVIIPKDRAARVTATVIKVSAGAISHTSVVQVTNLARALEQLKEAGHWILGLDVEGSQSLYEADLSVPLGLIIGNEQKGLRPLTRKLCDLLVRIPAHGPMESLNAAASGAVALAEVQRQRAST